MILNFPTENWQGWQIWAELEAMEFALQTFKTLSKVSCIPSFWKLNLPLAKQSYSCFSFLSLIPGIFIAIVLSSSWAMPNRLENNVYYSFLCVDTTGPIWKNNFGFLQKEIFFVLISTKYSLRHWTVVPHGFPCVSPCDDAYFIQTCICFWQIDFIMWISVKHITFMVGNEHEKLSPASVNVVNWVAELIQLKTGRIKRFYFKLDHVLGASSRGRGHNNLFTEAWAYAILNHVWIC